MPKTQLTEKMKNMNLKEGKDASKEITTGIEKMKIKDKDASEEITTGIEKMKIKEVRPSKGRKGWKQPKYREIANAEFRKRFTERLKRHKKSLSSRQATKMYGEEDTESDDTTEGKEREELSKKHFEKWWKENNSDEQMDLDFGKKQKKDIKGMIKKILLYGGLPTLLVVSLGVLSNKKFSKKNLKKNTKVKVSGKLKKNTKVKVSKEEKLFKKDFVKKLKEMILKRKKELDALEKDARNNEIESQNRQTRRKKIITNPFEKTPEYKEYKKIAGFGRTRNK